jgi:hypothetical protein
MTRKATGIAYLVPGLILLTLIIFSNYYMLYILVIISGIGISDIWMNYRALYNRKDMEDL